MICCAILAIRPFAEKISSNRPLLSTRAAAGGTLFAVAITTPA